MIQQALRLAREATNGWACFATRKKEHDEIARLHQAITDLEKLQSETHEERWQDISTAPPGEFVLYFPEVTKRNQPAMMKIDVYPVSYPRKPTHWRHKPPPPVDHLTVTDAGARLD